MPVKIPEPWISFLREIDQGLEAPVELHCTGGFVLLAMWDLPRPTGDIDLIEILPSSASAGLLERAGRGSTLANRFNLELQRVTVAKYPEGYASRLIDITPEGMRHLRLKALELHDLVLAKLPRNSSRDRADVAFLVERGALDKDVLKRRFESEMRPYVLNEKREALTMELWLEEFFVP